MKNCIAFSLALDESIDITDFPHLAVFKRFVSFDFVVKEELLDLLALQESTRSLNATMKTFNVSLNNLVIIPNDGVSAMLVKKISFIGLLRDDSLHNAPRKSRCILNYNFFERTIILNEHNLHFPRINKKLFHY